jgi:hypothetical protein
LTPDYAWAIQIACAFKIPSDSIPAEKEETKPTNTISGPTYEQKEREKARKKQADHDASEHWQHNTPQGIAFKNKYGLDVLDMHKGNIDLLFVWRRGPLAAQMWEDYGSLDRGNIVREIIGLPFKEDRGKKQSTIDESVMRERQKETHKGEALKPNPLPVGIQSIQTLVKQLEWQQSKD